MEKGRLSLLEGGEEILLLSNKEAYSRNYSRTCKGVEYHKLLLSRTGQLILYVEKRAVQTVTYTEKETEEKEFSV